MTHVIQKQIKKAGDSWIGREKEVEATVESRKDPTIESFRVVHRVIRQFSFTFDSIQKTVSFNCLRLVDVRDCNGSREHVPQPRVEHHPR